jgi:hypothetical protein
VETTSRPAGAPPLADTGYDGELDMLLRQSAVAEEFRQAVLRFFASGEAEQIQLLRHGPRVKVERLLKQVLSQLAGVAIERIAINGRSGCSDFAGTVEVQAAGTSRVIDFQWCCRWRAEEQGWTDYFGFPDQGRAAREYDWRCFRRWEERPVT